MFQKCCVGCKRSICREYINSVYFIKLSNKYENFESNRARTKRFQHLSALPLPL